MCKVSNGIYTCFSTGVTRERIEKPDIPDSSYDFDVNYYKSQYIDLQNAFGYSNSLYKKHWSDYGIREGRRSALWFDSVYYLSIYPDLRAAFGSNNYIAAREDWLNHGLREGRRGSADFDVRIYVNRYPDLKTAFGSDWASGLNHYIVYGRYEGRSGTP